MNELQAVLEKVFQFAVGGSNSLMQDIMNNKYKADELQHYAGRAAAFKLVSDFISGEYNKAIASSVPSPSADPANLKAGETVTVPVSESVVQ